MEPINVQSKMIAYQAQLNKTLLKKSLLHIDIEKYMACVNEMEQWVNLLSMFTQSDAGDKLLEMHDQLRNAEALQISNYKIKCRILTQMKL